MAQVSTFVGIFLAQLLITFNKFNSLFDTIPTLSEWNGINIDSYNVTFLKKARKTGGKELNRGDNHK